MNSDWTSAGAAVAIVLAGFEIYRYVHQRLVDNKAEQKQVDDALNKQPLIKEQLSIGNFGGAIEALNAVILSQGAAMQRQDEQHAAEIATLTAEHQRTVTSLRERLVELEDLTRECIADREKHTRLIAELTTEVTTLRGR